MQHRKVEAGLRDRAAFPELIPENGYVICSHEN